MSGLELGLGFQSRVTVGQIGVMSIEYIEASLEETIGQGERDRKEDVVVAVQGLDWGGSVESEGSVDEVEIGD